MSDTKRGWRAFLAGFGSLMDFGATRRPRPVVQRRTLDPRPGWERDAEALAGDWQRVGDDMRRAMERMMWRM